MSRIYLTEKEIHLVLGLAKDIKRDYALLHLMASTGLRSSDLLRLKIKDMIDQDGDIIRLLRLKMKKTGLYIEHPLRDDCREAIREWLGSREDSNPWLFCSLNPGWVNKNMPLSRVHHHKMMKKYLGAIRHGSELQGSSTHTLRRSVAKLIHNKTGKIAVAQKFLGHTSPANTSLYIDPDELKETANKIVLEECQW
jgi:integrase